MKQKTITLKELQIITVQEQANKDHEGDFSRMIRVIISEWEEEQSLKSLGDVK